ncbi:MAG: hypothetical protein RRB13_10950 [bacterium]|nr:hypothetical protein [bacterium]
MTRRRPPALTALLEYIVSRPPLATLTVGASILALLQLIGALRQYDPRFGWLSWLVPFIPPFFITRIAKRINQRRAEHDFISDAEPLILLSFLKKVDLASLKRAHPEMLSDSSNRHLGEPLEVLLSEPVLPVRFWPDPLDREALLLELLEQWNPEAGEGRLRHRLVILRTANGQEQSYWCNMVLRRRPDGRIKWQAILMAYRGFDDATGAEVKCP